MIDLQSRHRSPMWAEREILWVQAALTLPRGDQMEAFQDIADLTGRTFANVARQGIVQKMLQDERERAARLAQEQAGTVLTLRPFKRLPPSPPRSPPQRVSLPPSTLNTSARMEALKRGARA